MGDVERDDRVLPATRVLSVVIVPFLLLAFVVLDGWPGSTDRLFAWTIRPPLTSMVLAAAYLGGAYFFVRAAWARSWTTVKAGFPPVALFATLLGIATLVHWDRFHHGNVAFWLWVGLYATTPFLVVAVWLVNRRHQVPARADDLLVPRPVGLAVGAVGTLAALTGVWLYLAPERAIAVWPWSLTPLTARVMAAVLALGTVGIGALVERRWAAVRIMLQVEVLMLLLIAVGVLRRGGDLRTDRPLTWVMGVGFVLTLVASVGSYVRLEGRSHRPPAAAVGPPRGPAPVRPAH